jgi:peptidyl-prolyl cis-trans isomerase B (cyclophilin B)
MENMSNPKYKIDVTHGGNPLGTITIETFPEVAPKHATNFDNLVSEGFYDGTAFHRVIPGFMIQGGDPNSKTKPKNTWGFGDPTQKKVPAEFNSITHSRGIISAARSQDPNSASSQFFLVTSDSKFLDNQYTVYGKVIEGIEIADKIVSVPRDRSDNPDEKVEMTITKLEEIED